MLTCHLQILFVYGMALYMIQLFLMPATSKHVWRVEEAGMGGSWETGYASKPYRYQKAHTKMKNTVEDKISLLDYSGGQCKAANFCLASITQ